ncbi:Dorsal-ventral patterning tolloid-like protein 1, partial [Geodia barretti]
MLVTDANSSNSYAVFTYYCGDLSHATFASIGFGTEDGLHAAHEATFRGSAHSIACLNQPTSPWVNVVYELTNNENECEVENGGCEQICLDKLYLYECSCPDGSELNSDGRTCSDINECLDSNGGCEHVCNNTKGSYLCSCEEGYALNEDGRTCSITCGGRLTEVSGSFHTPDWPLSYPTEDFVCEWVIDIENTTDSVIEIIFDEPFGIYGSPTCQTDYVEVLDGVEDSSPSLGKHCYTSTPSPIATSSKRARVIFKGSSRSQRQQNNIVGVSIQYSAKPAVNECETDNGGCAHICKDSKSSYSCSCHEGFTLSEDKHNCSDIDECSTNGHGCEDVCINSEGSYSCGCSDGYALNEDGRTCSISCGGRLTEVSGSFHTPDWPLSYPTEDFVCEWVIDIENTTDSVIEISFNDPYGINGRDTCPTDYVEVLDGVEDHSRSLGKYCFWRKPDPILTSSSRAKVVFQGSDLPRPPTRVGVSIIYHMRQKVNECERDNGGCAHTCQDSLFGYSCHCHEGFTLDSDNHNCSDIDECATDQHGCKHICINTEGSYSCGCSD